MAENTVITDDDLPEVYTGWRSAVNHVLQHGFNTVSVTTNGQVSEFSYYWTYDLPSAETALDITAPVAVKIKDEEGGPWATVLGVLEVGNEGLICHKVKTIGFNNTDAAKIRTRAKKEPEAVFFDVSEDQHGQILKALAKRSGTEIVHKQRKKVKKNEEAAGDAASPSDQEGSVPELEQDASAKPRKVATKKAASKKAGPEAIREAKVKEAQELGLRPNANWKDETLDRKIAEAKSAKPAAAKKAAKVEQDEPDEDDDLATQLENSLAATEDRKDARNRRRQSAKAKVAAKNGATNVKKIVRKSRSKVKVKAS